MPEDIHDSTEPDEMIEDARQLSEKEGIDFSQAWRRVVLDHRIRRWPPEWDGYLQVVIYGDFDPPEADLEFPPLGIRIYRRKLENTVIRSAWCVLRATVTVAAKDVPAVLDAGRRLNRLLGALSLVGWGNGALGWWCHVTHGTGGGVLMNLAEQDSHGVIDAVAKLSPRVRQKVEAALYWIREPRNSLHEFYREDLLRVYSAYWNAFECLVDAAHLVWPQAKPSRDQKQKLLDDLLAGAGGKLTSQVVVGAYHEIVDPGFVGRASHVLSVCLPAEATMYITECFRRTDQHNRLYDIRNAIAHGDIDAENPEELYRIEARLHRLWMIVWRLFGKFLPFKAPVDSVTAERTAGTGQHDGGTQNHT